MTSIYDCNPSELVEKTAEEMKKLSNIKAPPWAMLVKTGMHKERPPIKNDWWYARAASILRKIYALGPIGVSKLRTQYGGKKNRGYKPERFYKGSGSIVRKIIQQLEKEGFVKTDLKSQHKGRLITAKGKKFLDDVASKIAIVQPQQKKESRKEEQAAKEQKKEEKEPAAKEQKSHASKAPEQKAAHDKTAEQKAQVEIKAAREKPQEKTAEAQ